MRDAMQVGDGVLFYHSSCPQPGIAGICEVASLPYPDASQYEKDSPYFDAKATLDSPRWVNVDVRLLRKTRLVNLSELRDVPELADMILLRRGNRLSISPVSKAEWTFIVSTLIGNARRGSS
jgi:predicted RNA-binding protein with PUA-like domain